MISLQQLTLEALGVPKDILAVNKQIYDNILAEIKQRFSSKKLSSLGNISLTFNGPFTISDYTMDSVTITIEVRSVPGAIQMSIPGASFSFMSHAERETKYKRFIPTAKSVLDVDMGLRIDVPEDYFDTFTWGDVAEYMNGYDKVSIMSTMAHELKHSFDVYKISKLGSGKGEKATSRMKYQSASKIKIGVPPLDYFFYLVYFTYYIENLVRPTEFAATLEYGEVSKKDFLKVLKGTEAYEHLKRAQNFSYDQMIQDIVSNPGFPQIKQFVQNVMGVKVSGKTNEQIMGDFLQFIFDNEKERQLNYYAQRISGGMSNLKTFLGLTDKQEEQEKQEAFNEIKAEMDKYKNAEAYFRAEEKAIRRNADKTLRKLAKLYAYIP